MHLNYNLLHPSSSAWWKLYSRWMWPRRWGALSPQLSPSLPIYGYGMQGTSIAHSCPQVCVAEARFQVRIHKRSGAPSSTKPHSQGKGSTSSATGWEYRTSSCPHPSSLINWRLHTKKGKMRRSEDAGPTQHSAPKPGCHSERSMPLSLPSALEP